MSNDLGRLNILSNHNQFCDPSFDRFGRFVCALSQLTSVFGDLQYLVGFVNGLFRDLEPYIHRFLSHLASHLIGLKKPRRLGGSNKVSTTRETADDYPWNRTLA